MTSGSPPSWGRRGALRGYSLAEVLMAFAVAAVGLLALSAAIAFAIRTEGRYARQTKALGYGSQILDLNRAYNLPGGTPLNDGAKVALNAAPFAADLPADPTFTRTVKTTRVSTLPTDYRSQLYQVDVTIFWYEKDIQENLHLQCLHRVP